MYSLQTDQDGEEDTAPTLKLAIKKAKALSLSLGVAVYISYINGGDMGDTHVAEYKKGVKVS